METNTANKPTVIRKLELLEAYCNCALYAYGTRKWTDYMTLVRAVLEVSESLAEVFRRQEAALPDKKCACGEKSTGWTRIKCCNVCGYPHEDETIAWNFAAAPVHRGVGEGDEGLPGAESADCECGKTHGPATPGGASLS